MSILDSIFGIGKELTSLQMGSRAVFVFIFTLFLIRISGRRSFGLRAPLDNIVLVLLGSVLARAVVGASPFIPTLFSGLIIAILHRLFAIVSLHFPAFGKLTKGEKILLYQSGKPLKPHLSKGLISEEDVMEEVRLRALTNSLEEIDAIYMERNGKISSIKKAKKDTA